ncbi:alpha-2,8-polysialyltransferase family protein [Flavihumibacter cheonanensis]|uniref:alpha-2,8-polysialyltransferase family protein n=1 Tax=Flavihumibacter cheonanensis TaxID=1442385 RepID=UPI001EF94ED3|nr:alpha-2,8-polysialyltransferase family protein [Flavihumibacter cheonanensis]MCG7753883.1 alpha-2,8-polysialyltransferase family protein [Flavihumibacter cheonanensis]
MNVLFLIHTEYHLMVIASFIQQYFREQDKFNVYVIIQVDPNKSRFKFKIDPKLLGAKEIIVVQTAKDNFVYDYKIKEAINEVMNRKYIEYISFLEQTALNFYFVSKLRKTGCKICLAPEGTKPYINITKFAIGSRLKATINNYRFLIAQKLYISDLYFVSNRNGFLKHTDEVWINHAESYSNITRKKVVPVDVLKDKEAIYAVSKLFNFDVTDHFCKTDGIILYLNHWVVEFKIYDYEIKMLETIRSMYPDKPIHIKLHPSTHEFQLKRLEKIQGIEINRSTIPAELFIASISNSIIFSFWSASLLLQNESCKFYWCHKLLEKEGVMMDWWSIVNPTKHIKEVESIEQIKF